MEGKWREANKTKNRTNRERKEKQRKHNRNVNHQQGFYPLHLGRCSPVYFLATTAFSFLLTDAYVLFITHCWLGHQQCLIIYACCARRLRDYLRPPLFNIILSSQEKICTHVSRCFLSSSGFFIDMHKSLRIARGIINVRLWLFACMYMHIHGSSSGIGIHH